MPFWSRYTYKKTSLAARCRLIARRAVQRPARREDRRRRQRLGQQQRVLHVRVPFGLPGDAGELLTVVGQFIDPDPADAAMVDKGRTVPARFADSAASCEEVAIAGADHLRRHADLFQPRTALAGRLFAVQIRSVQPARVIELVSIPIDDLPAGPLAQPLALR